MRRRGDNAAGPWRQDRRQEGALVHGSGFSYLMGTERPLPEVSADEVSEAKLVQACEVSVSGTKLV